MGTVAAPAAAEALAAGQVVAITVVALMATKARVAEEAVRVVAVVKE